MELHLSTYHRPSSHSPPPSGPDHPTRLLHFPYNNVKHSIGKTIERHSLNTLQNAIHRLPISFLAHLVDAEFHIATRRRLFIHNWSNGHSEHLHLLGRLEIYLEYIEMLQACDTFRQLTPNCTQPCGVNRVFVLWEVWDAEDDVVPHIACWKKIQDEAFVDVLIFRERSRNAFFLSDHLPMDGKQRL